MGKMIYLDNAATTKTAPEVVEAMLPYFTEMYGNPSSIYDFASKSKPPLKHINPKETTSSQQRSSIMQSFTPANILRKSAERRSHILM